MRLLTKEANECRCCSWLSIFPRRLPHSIVLRDKKPQQRRTSDLRREGSGVYAAEVVGCVLAAHRPDLTIHVSVVCGVNVVLVYVQGEHWR